MSTRIIRIWPLPEHKTQQEIRNALGDIGINRIYIGKGEAYVQLQNEDSFEVLEFTCPDKQIDQLDGANFQKVGVSFKWDSLSSDSSSIQDLKQQREHFEKAQEHITNLTQPAPENLITISNCNPKVVANITESQIKTQIFADFSTINRILKKGSKVVIQLQISEAQLLQAKFPNLQIPALGEGAFIDLDAQNEKDFSAQWIEQQKVSQGKKNQQQVKHVLHQQIIPKLNKLTSMETNFILSQNKQGQNTESNFTNITQQSSQYIHTNKQLPEEQIGFIMGDQWKKANKQQQQRKIQQQRQRRLLQQQKHRRQQQQEKKRQAQKVQRQKKQKQRQEEQRIRRQKQQRQRKQKLRLEEQRIQRQKQQRQRIQRQRIQRQRIQRQRIQRQRIQKQRIQTEHRERERHIREENQKLQRLKELKQRQQRQKEEIQRRQREAKQKQIQERLKKQNQQLEKERIRIQRQKQKQQQQKREKERIEKENAARKIFEEKRKQIQQAQRQERQINKGQFIIPQVINNTKENIESIIQKAKIDNMSNLGKTQAFWSIVLVTLLALLLI